MRGNKRGNPGTDHTTAQLLRELDLLQDAEPVPDIEPPRMIDQAVRNMARRALAESSAESSADVPAVPMAGSLRWIAGLSTVSIALIALGLSLLQSPRLPAPEAPAIKSELPQPKADSRLESEGFATTPANENFARKAASETVANEAVSSSSLEKDSAPAAFKLKQQVAETSGTQAPKELMAAPASSEEHLADEVVEPAGTGAPSAEAWLDQIRQLYDQGLLADAEEELRAFRADYPDYPLPDWAAELQP